MTSHTNIIIALGHIRDWLVSTGAMSGKKTSGFRANWTTATQFPDLMDWFKKNRGISPKSYYSAREFDRMCVRRYKQLIDILARYHNIEKSYDIGPCALMSGFQADISARVFEREQAEQQENAYRQERAKKQVIADNARPQLLSELQKIIDKRKALEKEFEIWKRRCYETNNTVLANSHHRNSMHARHNLP